MKLNLKECYNRIGGDYDDALNRLRSESCILKFLFKLLTDQTFSILKEAMAAGNVDSAFNAAHSLKGICLNFGLSNSAKTFSDLTELLRPRKITPEATVLFKQADEEFKETLEIIKLMFDADDKVVG